jgi:two-component system chemotaxis sensor kinase CheA
MDKFQEGFINEANDLLSSLESALLSLEDDRENKEMVGEIFRVMHSLKGTASMFGFDKIGELTHHLENIYDLIRSDKLVLTADMLTASLSALDLIHNLLEDPNLEKEENRVQFDALQKEIINIVKGIDGVDVEGDAEEVATKKKAEASYFVKVKMVKEIFLTGSNPLYLVDDLVSLGEAKTKAVFDFPRLDQFNFEHCFTSWEVLLVTDEDESEIYDAFMFVEDECELEVVKLSSSNIFKNESLEETVANFLTSDSLEVAKEIESILKKEDDEQQKKSNAKAGKTKASIRVDVDMVDELMNLVSQLVTTQASLNLFSEKNKSPHLEEISEEFDKLTRQLRDNAFGMSLIPLDSLFTRFKRLVRDTSKTLNKPIDFKTIGQETKLDKKIIETLTDPLMHILRNSLDHGVETPDKRKASGKDPKGKIQVSAYNSGAFVNISVKDDGGGINTERVREIAVKKGVIAESDVLTEQETKELIFAAGFSTAEAVTGLSGRGVGMDVVKKNIQSLRGEIILNSTLGEGTEVILKLPLTLSIIDGLLVRVGDVYYVIPVLSIERCIEIPSDTIKNNFNQLLLIENEQIPYFDLRGEFNVPITEDENIEIVIVWCNNKKVGLIVDLVIGENQAVLKPLGKYYANSDLFSGATILGDGSVALVVDPGRVISFFSKDSIKL